jgi:hypothetical protein
VPRYEVTFELNQQRELTSKEEQLIKSSLAIYVKGEPVRLGLQGTTIHIRRVDKPRRPAAERT